MAHEDKIRGYFAATVNKMEETIWIANPNIFIPLEKKGSFKPRADENSATANGKPDGEIKHHGQFIAVEFKAGEEPNGIWSFDGWRENQRNYYKKVYAHTKSPYWLCVGFWGGSYDIRHASIYLLPAETWLDMERWSFENTGMKTIAATPEYGLGKRKEFTVDSYLRKYGSNPYPTCMWEMGSLTIDLRLWS